jgi:hypothetical protein
MQHSIISLIGVDAGGICDVEQGNHKVVASSNSGSICCSGEGEASFAPYEIHENVGLPDPTQRGSIWTQFHLNLTLRLPWTWNMNNKRWAMRNGSGSRCRSTLHLSPFTFSLLFSRDIPNAKK